MEELNNCTQKTGKNICEFYQRLKILNSRTLSVAQQYSNDAYELPDKLQAINGSTLSTFIYHSHPAISQMLRWKHFNNLNLACTAVLSEERALNNPKI